MAAGAVTITPDASPVTITPDASPAVSQQPSQLSDFASHLWAQINPISGLKGAAQLAAHPIESLKTDASARQDVYDQAEKLFKSGDYSAGAAKLLYAAVPFVGPQLNQAANDFAAGKYGAGAGTSIGMGLAMAGPEAVKNANITLPGASAAENLSKRMYQTSLKPPPGSYSQPEVQSMVSTGLENQIPVSAAGRVKLNDLVSDLNDTVQSQIKAGSEAGKTVNAYNVATRLADPYAKFGNQVTPLSDLANVRDVGQEFLANQPTEIPASQAQAIKSGTYQQLQGKYGELSSATVEAQKALARGIKEELQTQFPEIQGLNAQESRLIGLDGALERAVNRTTNRDIFSLGGKIASVAGATVGAASGGAEGAALGAATLPILHYVLTDPAVSSKIAIALSKASKGSLQIGAAQARIGAYTDALGNSIASQSGASQQTNGVGAQ